MPMSAMVCTDVDHHQPLVRADAGAHAIRTLTVAIAEVALYSSRIRVNEAPEDDSDTLTVRSGQFPCTTTSTWVSTHAEHGTQDTLYV